jgi:opacity protein-like surface antigen
MSPSLTEQGKGMSTIRKRQCAQCGAKFHGTSRAVYCSTKCRVAANRGKPKMKKLMLVTAISAISFGVMADQEFYLGASTSFLTYSEEYVSDEASLSMLGINAGLKINDYFGLETRLGIGMGDDTVSVYDYNYGQVDVDVELDSMIGFYAKFTAPVHERIKPYVIAGYTKGEVTYSSMGFSESESESDLSYGVGFDLTISPENKVSIGMEYMSYFDKDGAEIDGFSFSLNKTF